MDWNDNPMPAEYVAALMTLLEESGVRVWVDGGWGVDALLGEQTRPHQDLDIAVDQSAVAQILSVLSAHGYQIVHDELPTRVELHDRQQHRVDIHPLTFDAHGNGLQALQDGTFGTYSAEGLAGKGLIGGVAVSCLSPELQVRFHTGYAPDEQDVQDVYALHNAFGIGVPEEYQNPNTWRTPKSQ